MLQDKDKGAIVRAILSLAKSLHLTTTADGIECAELAQALADYGCMLGQGFHFTKPMSAPRAYEFWLSRTLCATISSAIALNRKGPGWISSIQFPSTLSTAPPTSCPARPP